MNPNSRDKRPPIKVASLTAYLEAEEEEAKHQCSSYIPGCRWAHPESLPAYAKVSVSSCWVCLKDHVRRVGIDIESRPTALSPCEEIIHCLTSKCTLDIGRQNLHGRRTGPEQGTESAWIHLKGTVERLNGDRVVNTCGRWQIYGKSRIHLHRAGCPLSCSRPQIRQNLCTEALSLP